MGWREGGVGGGGRGLWEGQGGGERGVRGLWEGLPARGVAGVGAAAVLVRLVHYMGVLIRVVSAPSCQLL